MKKALLVLEDGTWYSGKSFGSVAESSGEVVFNTCMTGYQEVITDPSYKGQIVVMTYPLIGNYGFNNEDNESSIPQIQGFVVKELCDMPSNWRSTSTPDDFFNRHNITGICDIDTRHLTQHIRNHGSMYGIISTADEDIEALALKARLLANKNEDLVSQVTTKTIRHIEGDGSKIVVLDLGVKENILRSLSSQRCDIFVVPADTTAAEILSMNPDGIMLSNGPGNPVNVPYALDTVRNLIGKKPIMGICLGHQLLGMALGGQTYKLKFGHHGGNHPVKDLRNNRIYITSQNHNYALKDNFSSDIHITHINFNDNTVEGFIHKNYPIISVQYHPEASPGPDDSGSIFADFVEMVKKYE